MVNARMGNWPEGFVCNARAGRFHGLEEAKGTVHRTYRWAVKNGNDVVEETFDPDRVTEQCMCSRCLQREFPNLLEGEPASTERIPAEELSGMGLVGLYQRKPQAFLGCGICHKSLAVSDPDHIAKVREGTHQVVHYDCLEADDKDSIGGVVPYILREEADDDRVSRDEDGGEVLRGPDTQGDQSPGEHCDDPDDRSGREEPDHEVSGGAGEDSSGAEEEQRSPRSEEELIDLWPERNDDSGSDSSDE